MNSFEHNSELLAKVHGDWNAKKVFCHFTGFLEGIAASGYLEVGEIEPLVAESIEFLNRFDDFDAHDVIEDFKADILQFEMIADAVQVRSKEIDPSCDKSSLNRFLGFCRGVVCDGVITTDEANAVLAKIRDHQSLKEVVGVRQIELECLDAVEDGIVDAQESDAICEAIGRIVGDAYGDTGIAQTAGTANFKEFKLTDIYVDLEGSVIVLTGNFQDKPRSKLEERLVELGAVPAKHVSGKTDYLIIGGEASRDWIEMHRGTKMRKAQELLLLSDRPRFVSEAQIRRLLQD
ncbi:MAG: BRCT domain-containing protein [Pseudomonadota bacterium]